MSNITKINGILINAATASFVTASNVVGTVSSASFSTSASFAQTSSLSLGTNIELTINGTTQDLSADRSYSIETIMYGNPNDVIPAGLTRYYGFSDVVESTVELNRRIILPRACTFSKFYILTSNVQPATGSYIITILKNGVATAITVTIPAGSLAGQYTDLINSVSFAAGDGISILVINNASTNSANIVSVSILYI